jgi:putative NADPH-quinone reductase
MSAREKIKWADHLVWIHPVWWGGLPALTKGFIDRVFLPGFAFRYRENSVCLDKFLIGKAFQSIQYYADKKEDIVITFNKPN